MVVRDSQVGAVSAVMDGFRSLRIKAVVEGIPEAEDWGTADSLRHLRPRIKVSSGHCVCTEPVVGSGLVVDTVCALSLWSDQG